MNLVTLIGRLTREPQLTSTNSAMVCKFTLAVNRQKRDEADFIQCVTFNKTAELMSQFLHKGSQIGIEGRIQTGSYEKDGNKIYTFEVIANRIEFLDSKPAQQTQAPNQQASYQYNAGPNTQAFSQYDNFQNPPSQLLNPYQNTQASDDIEFTADMLPF